MVDDLISFLRARLEKRKARALAASHREELPQGDAWIRECRHSEERPPGDGFPCRECCVVDGASIRIYDEGGHDSDHAQHIADNDPRFVLADVAAKRRIIDRLTAMLPNNCYCSSTGSEHHDDAVQLLRLLALPYADHPDYQESWKP